MSRPLSPFRAMVLGLVVLAGLGLGILGLFTIGSKHWHGRDSLTVRVGFPEIRGVEVGTRVRIRGIDAGEVIEISPPAAGEENVLLTLRIKGLYREQVRHQSTVSIISEGMLGSKVLEIRPPRRRAGEMLADSQPALENALLKSENAADFGDLVGQVGIALQGLQEGKGTLGLLMQDPSAYQLLVTLLKNGTDAVEQGKGTLETIQRDAEALKKVPLVGRYVEEDPFLILVRPDAERNRQIFAEEELFEPGRAVLTAGGKEKLDRLAPWLEGLKHKNSEVVVVAFADPKNRQPQSARQLTKQQADAVLDCLRKQHSVQKMGWFSSRKVIPLGMGNQASPLNEKEAIPAARIEILVFVPQNT